MRFQHDPEGLRLPIKLDTSTNGEYAPIPLSPVHHEARRLAFESPLQVRSDSASTGAASWFLHAAQRRRCSR